MNLLKSMKIGPRIWIGFGSLIGLLTIICVMAVVSLTGADRDFADYRQLTRLANQVGDVQAAMIQTRLAAERFVVHGTIDYAEPVTAGAEETIVQIRQALDLTTDQDLIGTLHYLEEQLATYASAFSEVVEHQAERNEYFETLRDLGPEIERSMTNLMETAFQGGDLDVSHYSALVVRNLLLGRLYASLFLVNNDAASYDRAMQEISDMRDRAETLQFFLEDPEQIALAEQALAGTQAYADAFLAVQTAITARNGLIENTLDQVGPNVAAAVEELKSDIQHRQGDLGDQANADVHQAVIVTTVFGGVAVVLGLLAAAIIGSGIARPIKRMTGAMHALADGDTDTIVPAQGRRDEVGDMANAVQVFKTNMIRNAETAAEAKAEEEKRVARAARIDALTQAFDLEISGTLEAVASSSSQMSGTADGLSAAADQSSSQATAVSAAAGEASANVQTVAAAAEQLGASIQEIARQVHDQTSLAGQATVTAGRTNEQVQRLDDSAREIGEVVRLINEIAEQTNLLALNATIEAARAGDAGKGFAVVASEVKNLASQTSKATDTIAQKVAQIQTTTGGTVKAIEEINNQIARMSQLAGTVAAAVEEQDASTQEISRNVQQAAVGTEEVSSNITGVTEAARETDQSANEVLAVANELSKRADTLRGVVGTFLTNIRAA